MDCKSGNENATVFPEPVFACPMTSLPFISGPMALSWMGVGFLNPIPSTPLLQGGSSFHIFEITQFCFCFYRIILVKESEA